MAYDQGYYQAPQRPYNGRAAQPPALAYGRGAPAQQYPPQGSYGRYAQDDYGRDEYGNGYAQTYDDQYQQQMNGGGGGQSGHYPQQTEGYPPQQEYYGNGGGRGRGEDPRSQSRNGGRGGAPYARPPTADSARGAYEYRDGKIGRGYPDVNGGPGGAPGNAPPEMGRGGRPPPLGRSAASDPGSRRPLAPAQPSPQEIAWDTPFPSFPGGKKKTSISEEQKITQQMASMDVNDSRWQKTPGYRNGQDPRSRGPPEGDAYGRPSGEIQQSGHPRGYPPQQPQPGYGTAQGQRPGPGPGPGPAPGYGRLPKQNGYGPSGYDQGDGQQSGGAPASPINDNFGPISRSMTLPNDMSMGANSEPRYPPQAPMDGLGASAPYHGLAGRAPPRPATANDIRPPPRRTYPQQPPQQPYNNSNGAHMGEKDYLHQQNQISDLYDTYYDPELPINGGRAPSIASEIPDFSNMPTAPGSHRRTSMDGHLQEVNGNSMPQRQQVNGYQPMSRMKSQPDFRAQVQPQSAVYEMASDAPPMPNGQPQQGYPDGRYGQQGSQMRPQNDQRGPPMGRGHDGYDQEAPQGYDQPQPNVPGGQLPNGPLGGNLPTGSAPYNNNGGMPQQQGNSLPKSNPPANPNRLPSHPTPVRAGLIPNSVANQANNKPPPVRNYNNNSNPAPATQDPSSTTAIKAPPPGPPPVTLDEIERLKVMVKNNPNDQAAQLTLARKWIEAADVLVGQLPDQKSRNKARERYIFDANKMLKKLVAAQNADAMFYLADCYGRGALGLETDNKEAFTLYQSAAKAGHAGAAYRTAVCCELGNEEGGGTRKDPLKAIQWYKRAAMLGDTPAMYKMGMIQLKGLLGQPKNPREAVGWLKRAAERADAENPHALHELGLLYESQQPADGSGAIIRDEAYSLSLFTQAAELGYKFSQFRLGSAYEYGLFNLPIDPRLSIMWYSRAAVQEEHQSELALSGWYLTGSEGVLQQSDTEAYLWARKAAMAGLAKAEYAMGYFTEVGIGAPADLEGAKRWYWRAAAQNFPKARERLEDLKKGGSKQQPRGRERVSRSKIGKQNEGECVVM